MDAASFGRLLLLAGLWGAAFVWFKMAGPAFGALLTGDLRALLGGLALVVYLWLRGEGANFRSQLRSHGWHFLGAGMLSAALPFMLYSFAAKHMPASYLAITNATSPMWAAITAALVGMERLSGRRIAGFVLGFIGVAIVVEARGGLPAGQFSPQFALGMAAAVAAAMCYGSVVVYIRRFLANAEQATAAGWSQLLSGLVLLPVVFLEPAPGPVTLEAVLALAGLALGGSAWGFVLYYRLVADVGPLKAVTVTFLIPLFSMLWGVMFAGESVTAGMLAGCAVVLAGTAMVIRR